MHIGIKRIGQAPRQRGPNVVKVDCGLIEPVAGVWLSNEPLAALGQVDEPGKMPTTRYGLLASRLKPLQGVLADRLQHREAWLIAGAIFLAQQALVHQRRDPVESCELCVVSYERCGIVPARN